jgi:hypothetical protein
MNDPRPNPTTRSAADVVAQRYRMVETLGEGGFGSVYLANDLRLGVQVALKLLHPDILGRDNLAQRFAREAELAKQLNHPHIVRLLDHGSDHDGTPYIAYELLRGETLKDAIRRGAMPPERVVHVAAQVLRALGDAHAQGIVHRDIKPANIMLCDFAGAPDFVKVLDFGIARVDAPQNAQLTATGSMPGTPSYMAPEQVRGLTVCPGTDLYSLGLVMGEMLSARRLVVGDSAPMIALEQASERPVALPLEVSNGPLAAVVQRAVDKDLQRRYASAPQMLADLEAAAAGWVRPQHPAHAAPPAVVGSAAMPATVAPQPAFTTHGSLPHTQAGQTTAGSAKAARSRGLVFSLAIIALLLAVVGGLAAMVVFAAPDAPQRKRKSKAASPITRSLLTHPGDAKPIIRSHQRKGERPYMISYGSDELALGFVARHGDEIRTVVVNRLGVETQRHRLLQRPAAFDLDDVPFGALARVVGEVSRDIKHDVEVLQVHIQRIDVAEVELFYSATALYKGESTALTLELVDGRWGVTGLVPGGGPSAPGP